MKIKTNDGEVKTPKVFAEDILADSIYFLVKEWYTVELESYGNKLTEAQQKAVNDQMVKIGSRLLKKMGFEHIEI